MSLLCKPALYTHIISALLMAVAFIYFVQSYKVLRNMPFQLISVLLLGSIALVLHGDSHMNMEKQYGFDPLCQML